MKRKRIILWTLVILWMIVIFSFSQNIGDESSSKSKKVVTTIVEVVEKNKTKKQKEVIVNKIHIPFRKIAHALEYGILCILLILALKTTSINNIYSVALIMSIIYASTDEIHQLFISGRSGEMKDICIDTIGAFIGLLLYKVTQITKKRIVKN